MENTTEVQENEVDFMPETDQNESPNAWEERPLPEEKEERTTQQSNQDEPEIDLLAELKKPTDKDLDGSTLNNDKPASGKSDLPKPELANTSLIAKMAIATVSVGMGMALQCVSGDWSESAEKRYALSASRKAELLEPLEMVLSNSKTKMNPIAILIITILLTYIPMFINAFRVRKDIQRQKRNAVYGYTAETQTESPNYSESNGTTNVQESMNNSDISEKIKAIKAKIGRRSKADAAFLKLHGY